MKKFVYLPFGNFFPIEKALVTSMAWLSLSGTAKDVYLIFWTKTKHVAAEPKKKGRKAVNLGDEKH